MLDTLQKMSGTTHKAFKDSKTLQVNKNKLFNPIEDQQSVTISVKEIPVISYNDMAFISERNSIVFRAGDSPIWNRNEMILPMSWRLFQNTITHPGHDYSLQTIPTLSSALDFDVRKNQPDFIKMVNKRIEQFCLADAAREAYQRAYGYSDFEISQLDPDNYADDIMSVINSYLRTKQEAAAKQDDAEAGFEMNLDSKWIENNVEKNTEQLQATAEVQKQQAQKDEKRYAGGLLSREDLVSTVNGINHTLDKDIIQCYNDVKGDMWGDRMHFVVQHGDLYGANNQPFIVKVSQSEDLATLQKAAESGDTQVYQEKKIDEKDLSALGSYQVTDNFYRFLVSLESWDFAKGKFEQAMARRMSA